MFRQQAGITFNQQTIANEESDAPATRPQEPDTSGGGDAGSVAVVEKTKTVPHRRVDHMPPWKVLLHNDDVSYVEDVVRAIREIASLPLEEAVRCMLEAHRSGVALVLRTHRERAELLAEQFHSKRLTVTIEPDV